MTNAPDMNVRDDCLHFLTTPFVARHLHAKTNAHVIFGLLSGLDRIAQTLELRLPAGGAPALHPVMRIPAGKVMVDKEDTGYRKVAVPAIRLAAMTNSQAEKVIAAFERLNGVVNGSAGFEPLRPIDAPPSQFGPTASVKAAL